MKWNIVHCSLLSSEAAGSNILLRKPKKHNQQLQLKAQQLSIWQKNQEETHNHGVTEVRKGLWFHLAQPLLKQHHPEESAQTHVQEAFGDLQGQGLCMPVEEKKPEKS